VTQTAATTPHAALLADSGDSRTCAPASAVGNTSGSVTTSFHTITTKSGGGTSTASQSSVHRERVTAAGQFRLEEAQDGIEQLQSERGKSQYGQLNQLQADANSYNINCVDEGDGYGSRSEFGSEDGAATETVDGSEGGVVLYAG
jgi:hypothetical protein